MTLARNHTCAPLTPTHSPILSPPIKYHSHTHKISHLAIPHTHKISHLAILPKLIITNNTVPSRKDNSKTMPTKKAPRKETGQLSKKSSVATSTAAAKRDPAITVPSPHQRKGQTTRQLPLLPCAISDMQVASKKSPPIQRPVQRQLRWELLLALYLSNK